MHGQAGWHGLVDAGQEATELDGPVAVGQVGDDLARGHVQGGVQVVVPWRVSSWVACCGVLGSSAAPA